MKGFTVKRVKTYTVSILIDNYFKQPTITARTPDEAREKLHERLENIGWENKEYTILSITERTNGNDKKHNLNDTILHLWYNLRTGQKRETAGRGR